MTFSPILVSRNLAACRSFQDISAAFSTGTDNRQILHHRHQNSKVHQQKKKFMKPSCSEKSDNLTTIAYSINRFTEDIVKTQFFNLSTFDLRKISLFPKILCLIKVIQIISGNTRTFLFRFCFIHFTETEPFFGKVTFFILTVSVRLPFSH